MKVLITGSSGFIGKNLVEHLATRYELFVPSRAELDLADGEAVRKYLKQNPIDAIVHCAVKPGHRNAPDPSGQLFENTKMFFNLVRNQEHFDRFIFLSSGLVYDQRHYIPKMSEDYFDSHIPSDEGGLSKYISSKYIAQTPNMVELRPFGVFGPHEDYAIRFISNAICKCIFDLPITIKQNRKLDYIHVFDLALVVEQFLRNRSNHKAYNVTGDRAYELRELANLVLNSSGKDLPIKIALDGMGQEYSGDNTRLRREFQGFSPMPMEKAIKGLYSWYFENKHIIKKELLLIDK
jgi:GDP-L-fucose synthase